MTADRDRETREAEAREEIARALWEVSNPAIGLVLTPEQIDTMWEAAEVSPLRAEYRRIADAVLALPALRAVREGDALRRHRIGPVRQAALVLSDDELNDALSLWYEQRARDEAMVTGRQEGPVQPVTARSPRETGRSGLLTWARAQTNNVTDETRSR